MRALGAILILVTCASTSGAQLLDKHAELSKRLWLDNRDVDWFAARIPLFESPDKAIDDTYYYRWELVTKHLTYGSPESGYTFTEFIDRPFWSGAYGAISCPLGHQMEEVRWLNDHRVIEDFARYWFETPGAQPRSYSNWYSTAVWETYEVLGDTGFLRSLLPYMKRQYLGWTEDHWDVGHRMFRWDGLHDGMERNINSRQTDDIDEGAEGYRPTLNSYLYGDARAIARTARLFGDTATARRYDAHADSLRQRVQRELWDERREFFLHQWARDDKDGVKALTRTYDTGKYLGNAHGRELIGYVPWQFNLPEPGKGYERAWKFLMDTAFFFAPYGPTTTERHDPQFFISDRCCWWSGNSWPYATTQTLVAMANLLRDYEQNIVSARDWMTLFDIYTRTQRKDGVPYVAEGANPDDGSWRGFDTPHHSEHYFHSGYVNLVITGVAGLRPRADDSVEVHPLAPPEWGYFALDDVQYHGRRLSILWDRDGTRYGRGPGLTVFADGRPIAHSPRLERIVGRLTAAPATKRDARTLRNVAVNNGRGGYPWVDVSYAAPATPPTYLVDGNYWYGPPTNRWTTEGSSHASDTVLVHLGMSRRVQRVTLYILDDGDASPIRAPARYEVQAWRTDAWVPVSIISQKPGTPEGHRANTTDFQPITTSLLRVILHPHAGAGVGLSEVEVWSDESLPLARPRVPAKDLAYRDGRSPFPRASASFTGTSDRVEHVNDMQVAFTRYSRNRWTAYGSPNASDWVQLDFGAPRRIGTVELYLYGDDGGVKAPRDYTVQVWRGTKWKDARVRSRFPEMPQASARNLVKIEPVVTPRIRVVFQHALPAVTGVTELIIRAP